MLARSSRCVMLLNAVRGKPQAATIVADPLRLVPGAMIEIPACRRLQACVERVLRRPPKIPPKLAGIDGVAAIVTRSVGHEMLQVGVTLDSARLHCRIVS